MAKDVCTANQNSSAITTGTVQQNAMQMMDIIASAAKDPSIDVAKMTELVNLQERIADRQSRQAYIVARESMQSELPIIGKRGEIKNNKGGVMAHFATWDAIHQTILPILKRHAFVIDFKIGNQNNMVTVECVLSHVQGHVESGGAMLLPQDTSGAKNSVQGMGSSVSYGKRYTTCAMLNILTEGADNDANSIQSMEEKNDLKDMAEKAASCGIDAYKEWFKRQNQNDKLYLVRVGKHDQLKRDAADVQDGD